MRRRLSLAFYSILQKMSRIDILPNVGDFRLLDRRCVLTLRHLREQERYTKGLFCWIGYRKKSIEFDRGDRLAGHSSWSFFKLLNLAIEGITSSSTAPLRIATVCGILCSISSFIYAIYFLIKTIIYGDQAARFPHPDSRYSILGRHPTVLIGCYRRVYRTYFQRDQKTPCLYRIGLQ